MGGVCKVKEENIKYAVDKINFWYRKNIKFLTIVTVPFNTSCIFCDIINTISNSNKKILYIWGKNIENRELIACLLYTSEIAPKFKSNKQMSVEEFISEIKKKYPDVDIKAKNINDIIYVEKYNKSGSVNAIRVGRNSIKGTEFRKLFNLNSTYFTLDIRDDIVTMSCTGYGHGMGMSQWGANVIDVYKRQIISYAIL